MMGSPIYLFIYLLTYAILLCPKECVCVCVSGMPGVPSCRETPFLQVVLNPPAPHEGRMDEWMDGWMMISGQETVFFFQLTLAIIMVVKFSGFSTTLPTVKTGIFSQYVVKKTSPYPIYLYLVVTFFFNYLFTYYIYETLMEWVTKVKPNINSG